MSDVDRELAEIRERRRFKPGVDLGVYIDTILCIVDNLRAENAKLTAERDATIQAAAREGEALGREDGSKLAIGKALDEVLTSGEDPEQFMSDVPQWRAIVDGIVERATALLIAERDKAIGAPLASNGSWEDLPLPEDEAIDAAHPMRRGRHDLYAEAMRLVGAKRSKGALVALVNWLLLERDAVLRTGEPWPLVDILRKLADAADHLLTDHDCDAHGWEGVTCARDAARALLAKLESPEAGGDVFSSSPVRTEDAGGSESPGDAPLASGGSVAAAEREMYRCWYAFQRAQDAFSAAQRAAKQEP